jgi:GWxTD domain-containing protein
MIKYIVLLFVLLLSLQIHALEVIANTSGGKTSLHILVPVSQYVFSAQSSTARYQISLNMLNSENNNVCQNFYDIVIDKNWLIDETAQVFSLDLKFNPGNYRLVTSLQNQELGDKTEKQLTFVIPDSSSSQVTNIIIAQNENIRFSPASYSQLGPELKSCVFMLDTATECDSIVLKVSYTDGIMNYLVPRHSGMAYDLLPLLKTGSITNLEVRYYDKNIISTSERLLYKSYDRYLHEYTPDEQLEQLRYIANQNEWKTIKKIAEKEVENAIEYFWEQHDNSPSSLKNDFRELFYTRILKADEMFTIHKNLPGWRSDRGRIFIKLGPPDEVISDPFPIGKYPYIVWYYYNQNLIYRFIDKRGFGDYKLEEGYYEN